LKDTREASDPSDLLALVRAAEEEATLATRERPSEDAIDVASIELAIVEEPPPSEDVIEVGAEAVRDVRAWPPLLAVPLLLGVTIAALALVAR